jgi:hypothetical protein
MFITGGAVMTSQNAPRKPVARNGALRTRLMPQLFQRLS